jgi:hypothetical protein
MINAQILDVFILFILYIPVNKNWLKINTSKKKKTAPEGTAPFFFNLRQNGASQFSR